MGEHPSPGSEESTLPTVSESGTNSEAAPQAVLPSGTAELIASPAGVTSATTSPTISKWYRWRRDGTALARYLLDSEVHTFAFSVAANAILSFLPFIVLLYTLAQSVFHSKVMVSVISDMVNYFLPSTAREGFLTYNLEAVVPRHGVQILSLIMILVSCTGIFLPLEVALNQAWGVSKSRNYLLNQAVAFGLAGLMLVLALASIFVNAGQQQLLAFLFFHHVDNFAYRAVSYFWLTISTGAACIVFFFSIYWILPNCKVPWRPVLRTSIATGIVWLGSKWVYAAILPHLDLKSLYGPFYVSVGLLIWGYVSGLILFAGAQFSVARLADRSSHPSLLQPRI
jgi:membrane protein